LLRGLGRSGSAIWPWGNRRGGRAGRGRLGGSPPGPGARQTTSPWRARNQAAAGILKIVTIAKGAGPVTGGGPGRCGQPRTGSGASDCLRRGGRSARLAGRNRAWGFFDGDDTVDRAADKRNAGTQKPLRTVEGGWRGGKGGRGDRACSGGGTAPEGGARRRRGADELLPATPEGADPRSTGGDDAEPDVRRAEPGGPKHGSDGGGTGRRTLLFRRAVGRRR